MTTPLPDRLLIRKMPLPGESLLSLVARVARANVIESSHELLKLAGIDAGRTPYLPFAQVERFEAVAALLGVPPDSVRSRMHPRDAFVSSSVLWYGTRLPRRLIEAEVRRFSATSLGQQPMHRASWMVRGLSFCPETMEVLQTHCPHCGSGSKQQGWVYTRGIDNCDHCGRSLCNTAATFVDSHLWDDARSVAALVHVDPTVRARALHRLPEPFNQWEPGDAFEAIVDLGLVTNMDVTPEERHALINQRSRGNYASHRCEDLVRGYHFVLGWPDSLAETLPRLWDRGTLSIHKLTGPFGKYFVSASGTVDTPFRNFMRESIIRVLDSHDVERGRRAGVKPAWIKPSPYITPTGAEKKYFLERPIVRLLSKKGKCARPAGKGRNRLDEAELVASLGVKRNALRATECAWMLGVPPFSIEALVTLGLVVSVTDHDALLMSGEPLYERESVQALLANITRAPLLSGRIGVGVTEVLRRTLNSNAWAAMVSAIMSGEVGVVSRGDKQPIIETAIDVGDARRFLDGLPPTHCLPGDGIASCIMADRLMGYSEGIAGAAHRVGLLRGRSLGYCVEVALIDLFEFDRLYVTSREAGEILSLHNGAFPRLMARAGFSPVAKLKNSMLWKRVDVDQAVPGGFNPHVRRSNLSLNVKQSSAPSLGTSQANA